MELNRKYRLEREAAFGEIEKAFNEKIKELALWSQTFTKGKTQLLLPEHMELQERFRWPSAVICAASDLKDGKKSLKEIFGRVSGRYEGRNPQQVLGIADDFTRSVASKTDGRLSAFEDIHKLLDVAERDFDATYKPLSWDQIEYWQKTHPLDPPTLEYAYRENQRHFMKESLKEMRELLNELQTGKPRPGAAPRAPRP